MKSASSPYADWAGSYGFKGEGLVRDQPLFHLHFQIFIGLQTFDGLFA